ncbi:hypothetical protein GWK08_07895 [Leptobacterium flavescens]|uniref:Uncharacterized protein n=2 Tax=Leptobacterium flavescens TaxID=472055 RepID=A0A6P0UJ88_9FLAO|nr:hypothetical protein [Leptobacterium flavescens]
MLFKRVNIEEKLSRVRRTSDPEILKQVDKILAEDNAREERIFNTLGSGKDGIINDFDIDLLESDRIYHISHIKKICIDYRLRFLDSRYFKGKFPPSALSKIKELEKKHGTELAGFKMVAPSKLFKLENADDPLLFAPLGNDYFYLIHRWGNDLHPLRKWMMLPFRNLFNLLIFILAISWIFTSLLPMQLFTRESSTSTFMVLYMFMFKAIASIVLFYGFALGKNFNHAIWNSRYFNA